MIWRLWDSGIRPEGDCCGTDRVVGINSRQLSCLTNFLHHVVKFIDAERLVVVPNGIGRRSVSARILEKCRTFGVEFGKIELHSFVAIVWTVRFIHSCIFFRAAGIFQATGMVFRHSFVRHGHVISPARIDIQFEAGFLQLSLPFAASSAEVHQTFLRRDRGLVRDSASDDFSYSMSSSSSVGLCWLFSLPSFFS